jgi:hypothetical protein
MTATVPSTESCIVGLLMMFVALRTLQLTKVLLLLLLLLDCTTVANDR